MFPGADEEKASGAGRNLLSLESVPLQKEMRFWGAGGAGRGPTFRSRGTGPPGGPGGTLRMAAQSVSKQPGF